MELSLFNWFESRPDDAQFILAKLASGNILLKFYVSVRDFTLEEYLILSYKNPMI